MPPPFRAPPTPSLQAWLAQAAQLRNAGRFAEAIAPMAQAARAQPKNAGFLHDLGLTCLMAGRPRDAIPPLRQAIAVKPDFAHAHLRLAIALEQLRQLDEAVVAYRRATELDPKLSEGHYRLANILEERGARGEAVARYGQAAKTAPTPATRRIGEARALMMDGKDLEAAEVLRGAAADDPNNAVILDLMGTSLSNAGAFEQAADCFERALAKAPRMVGVYYDLVRCRKYAEPGDILRRMLEARELPGIDPGAMTKLNLAIAKVQDDLGDYAAAMAACDEASRIRRQVGRYEPESFRDLIARTIKLFDKALMAKAAQWGDPTERPILIVGMPRSGTTLVEQILSSHPQVGGAGEVLYWFSRAPALFRRDASVAPSQDFVRQAAQDYLAVLSDLVGETPRVTDKMPFNFLFLGLIHLAFPNATIIHCRRQPIDTAISIHMTYFAPNFPCPTGGEELVEFYRLYERLMAHWREVLPAERLIDVEYEALTSDPEPVVRAMLAAAHLPWDEACLHPEANDRVVKTPSKWQAKQPINKGSIDRWRRYEPYLGPLSALVDP